MQKYFKQLLYQKEKKPTESIKAVASGVDNPDL